MLNLGSWSFGRVVLASVLWVGLVVGAAVGGIYLLMRGPWSSTGSGGIGAVSGSAGVLSVFAILLGPPLALILAWLYLRRRR